MSYIRPGGSYDPGQSLGHSTRPHKARIRLAVTKPVLAGFLIFSGKRRALPAAAAEAASPRPCWLAHLADERVVSLPEGRCGGPAEKPPATEELASMPGLWRNAVGLRAIRLSTWQSGPRTRDLVGGPKSPPDLPAAAAPTGQAGEVPAVPEVSVESAGLHDEKPTAAAELIIVLLPPDDTASSPQTTALPAGIPRLARPRRAGPGEVWVRITVPPRHSPR
jgi:hypothetical protein